MIFDENEKPEAVVDKKSEELIQEFQSHYEELVMLIREMKYSRDG
jgi:hypothetical protein